jgi:hypothetical protein
MSTLTELQTEQTAYADRRRALLIAGDGAGLLALDARAAQLPALIAAAAVAQLRQDLAALEAQQPAAATAEEAAAEAIATAQAGIAAWREQEPVVLGAFNAAHGQLRAAQWERRRLDEQIRAKQDALQVLLAPVPAPAPAGEVHYIGARVARPAGA